MSAIFDPAPDDHLPIPSGTVTFAFTDIEGSTQRWDRNADAMSIAVRRHDALVRAEVERCRGYVFKALGDAFCVAFRRPEEALAAMVAVQRALAAQDFREVDGLRVRAAIHTGTADERDGDYFGPVLNRVARLLSIGHGGQILVSGATGGLVAGTIPADLTLRDLGEHRLKDLTASEHVFGLLAPDLPDHFPPLRSLDLHPNNLPLAFSTFIGREAEIRDITALLTSHRLVTLVGAGGIGKTRTSLQVAANLLDGSGDGVWFIEFAPLASGEYIATTIAHELGLTLGDRAPLDELVAALAPKTALLVFDNCEHLIGAAAHVADAILRGCASVAILASSREPLNIAGEHAYRLPSLAIPTVTASEPLTLSRAARAPAVALFVDRARAADRRFEMTDANVAIIVEICRRLDGIALAIELAAARVKILTPRQLRDRLDERFRVLTGGRRDVLPRQQTLRALIDWSYDLLDERERAIFRRLGIFIDGFTLEGAVAVAGGTEYDEFDLIDILTSLVDKSLLLVANDDEQSRYRMLESTRAYALERVKSTDEFASLAGRHAAFFAELARATMVQPVTPVGLAQIELEIDNCREALTWLLELRHDVVLGAAHALSLGYYWYTRLPQEGMRWLELAQSRLAGHDDAVLAAGLASAICSMLPHGSFARFEATERALSAGRRCADQRLLSRILCSYGEQLAPLDRSAEARAAFSEGLAYARAVGSDMDTARALAGLSELAVGGNDIADARRLALESIALFERIGAKDGVAYTSLNLSDAEFQVGNIERAIELTRRAKSILEELRNARSIANAAGNLAMFALATGAVEEARAQARDALACLGADHHPLYFTQPMEHLAQVATLAGDARRGARLQGYVDAVFAHLAHARSSPGLWCRERHRELLTRALSDAERIDAFDQGAALTEDAALAEALAV